MFLVVATLLFLESVSSQDIVGCGGFIQSAVPINYEQVQIKLYTKQGAFKSKTECAPNNGYFLVAVYDKGDYILRIDPPEGWSFTPQEIALQIDGVSDPCSKGEDLNFKFTGFAISGMVSSFGREQGPSGVSVDLISAGGEPVIVTTDDTGRFLFENVMPGEYEVKARHDTWLFKNERLLSKDTDIKIQDVAKVIVTDKNIVMENSIVVAGYDVKEHHCDIVMFHRKKVLSLNANIQVQGYVLSGGEPIQGVSFVLLSAEIKKQDITGCKEIPEEIIANIQLSTNEMALCLAVSEKDGSFGYAALPSGSYNLVPFYTAHNIVFEVLPQKLSFNVNYRSVEFKTPFQVYGFSVQGKVVDHKEKGTSQNVDVKNQGNGIDGVVVNVISQSDKRQSISGSDGQFVLENVTTGMYDFKLEKENYIFNDEKIHISPNTPILSNIAVKQYQLCGIIDVVQLPSGVLPIHRHKVLMQPIGGQNTDIKTVQPNKDGKFCFAVTPGKYKVEVPLTENEKALGFLLNPSTVNVEVDTKPVVDVKFEQFRAKVQGNIKCIATNAISNGPSVLYKSNGLNFTIKDETFPTVTRFPDVGNAKEKFLDERKKELHKTLTSKIRMCGQLCVWFGPLNSTIVLFCFGGLQALRTDCTDVNVYITNTQQSNEKVYAQVTPNGKTAQFVFNQVLPGAHKVTAMHKKWCWNPPHVEVTVKDVDVSDVLFTHSGYYLKCSISHNITLNFQLENSNETVGSFELKQGSNQFCLKTPGNYSLTPKSCYQFEQETYTYNTAEPKSLTLAVKSYQVISKIKSPKLLPELKLQVTSKSSGNHQDITNLDLSPEKIDGNHVYEATFWGKLDDRLTIEPIANDFYFYPALGKIQVAESCPGATANFEAREGFFIEGQVTPAFPGVAVSLLIPEMSFADESLDDEPLVQPEHVENVLTDEQGKYRVGPFMYKIEAKITAVKEGYHFTPHPEHNGSFLMHKLAHLTVKVQDEKGAAMGGVLLSLSGGVQYRNNNLTTEDGQFAFTNLGPGQYFLRPMEKEYSFEPNSKMIDIAEGEDLVVNIVGKRVAYSCSGNLASLSGIPEEKVEIEAVGLHKCSEYQENTVSDTNGNYRLRGLQPGCSYNVRLSQTNDRIERLAPANQLVHIQQDDLQNLDFIVFDKPTMFHLSVFIETDFKYLSHLKVLLYDNDDIDSPVHVLSPGYVKYIQFPPLKPKTYLVKLQSTLSSATHETRSTTASVTPDEHLTKQHIKLKFEANERTVDSEPTQSVVALPLAVALVFLAYNYDSVLALLLRLNVLLQSFNKVEGADSDSEREEDTTRMSKKKKR